MLTNQHYRDKFSFISPRIPYRWKLIDTGLIDDYLPPTSEASETPGTRGKLTPSCKRFKEEQSLFVTLMLNLAFVPDDVVYNLKNFEFGWSFEFFRQLDNYYSQKFPKYYSKLQQLMNKQHSKSEVQEHSHLETDISMADCNFINAR